MVRDWAKSTTVVKSWKKKLGLSFLQVLARLGQTKENSWQLSHGGRRKPTRVDESTRESSRALESRRESSREHKTTSFLVPRPTFLVPGNEFARRAGESSRSFESLRPNDSQGRKLRLLTTLNKLIWWVGWMGCGQITLSMRDACAGYSLYFSCTILWH